MLFGKAFEIATRITFKMDMIVMMIIWTTCLVTYPVPGVPAIVRNAVQYALIRKRMKGPIEGYSIILAAVRFQLTGGYCMA